MKRTRKPSSVTRADIAAATTRSRVSADDLPRRPLEEAIKVATELHSEYAGKAAWDQLADSLKIGRQTNGTKYLFWSASAYNLVTREEGNAFSLAETGRKICAPLYEGEDREAKVKAIMTPNVLSKFYSEYDGHPLPSDDIFPNVLERKFNVPRDRAKEAQQLIIENARFAGILAEEGGRMVLRLTGSYGSRAPGSTPLDEQGLDVPSQATASAEWDKLCFYVTPIGDEGTDVRRHADMMLKHLIEPVVSAAGLKTTRADRIEKSGLITQQVLEHLAYSRLCIADLSFGNPNAFYELGVRHMCLSPTIQVIRKGDKIPFDVSQGRTITVDTSDVYTVMDKFESARKELAEHVKSALSEERDAPPEDNPIAIYLPGTKTQVARRQ